MSLQVMFEENKRLQDEVDAFRSLIERWIPEMTPQILVMNDINKMREEFEDALENEDDEEDACEECGWWKPQCKCEEVEK